MEFHVGMVLRLHRFRCRYRFKLRINFSVIRVQIPDDLRILQQVFDVSLRRLQGEHIFRVIVTGRFEITLQRFHFTLHARDVFRRHALLFLRLIGIDQLIHGRSQNQCLRVAGEKIIGRHHHFRDFNLPHPADLLQ